MSSNNSNQNRPLVSPYAAMAGDMLPFVFDTTIKQRPTSTKVESRDAATRPADASSVLSADSSTPLTGGLRSWVKERYQKRG